MNVGAPPVLDPRDRQRILDELRARLPGYLPEWPAGAAAGEAGQAFLAVLARYREIFGEGLNGTPGRAFLAFLDTLGNTLLPAESARAPLVFTLLDSAPSDVVLPARSQVAAKLPPPPPSLLAPASSSPPEAPTYFTTQNVSLARARLAAVYSVDPASDARADHVAQVQSGFDTFTALTQVPHELYLGHDELFKLSGGAEVSLSIDMAGEADPAAAGLPLEWEYLSTGGWLPFSVEEDSTARFTRDGRIRLLKTCGPDSRREAISGHESYWLRARVSARPVGARIELVDPAQPGRLVLDRAGMLLPGDVVTVDGEATATVTSAVGKSVFLDHLPPAAAENAWIRVAHASPPLAVVAGEALPAVPSVDVIRARVAFTKGDLQPEAAFCDTVPLDTANTFFPFGRQPAQFTTFYLASSEAFSRRGARVTLSFDLARAGVARDGLVLDFEYSDGKAWRTLEVTLPVKLVDATEAFTLDGAIGFFCPDDWEPTRVNGKQAHWLRLRIRSGNYGHPLQTTVQADGTLGVVESTLEPPAVATLQVAYTYTTQSSLPDHCLASNDFAVLDCSEDVRWTRRPFEPFVPVADRLPALHLGFDRKLPAGLVGLYVAVRETDTAPAFTSPFVWEYRAAEDWKELAVIDETAGLRKSGMIQWVGPADAAATEGSGGMLYRIRARLRPGAPMTAAPIAGVWLNAAWGVQGQQVQREVIGRCDGNPGTVLAIAPIRLPVLAGEIIEVREWTGRGEDWRTAVAGVPESDLRFEHDPVTRVPTAAWVRWHGRDHLHASGPDDRHYALERVGGLLVFGDDHRGRIPPADSVVVASFTVGIGAAGNVPAGSISELRTGVAYLQAVSNPAPADGGAAPENAAIAGVRAARRLRHRRRALAPDDYEWMAREASPAVARARCLALTGADGTPLPGQLGVIVVPHSSERLPQPGPELLRRVSAWLQANMPACARGGLRVLPPAYLELGVITQLVPQRPEDAAIVEARVRERLDRWLHPLTGGDLGQGWEFGQPLYLSSVALLLESTPGVDRVEQLALRARAACVGDPVCVPAGAMLAAGMHELTVSVGT